MLVTIKLRLNTDGLIGKFVTPPGHGPFPAVLCIGGSSGGVSVTVAEPLAREGFAALALGYFGAPGTPSDFAELPLDYFEKAVSWLLAQPKVKGPKAGVTGTSRGSEAALQLATISPLIGATVVYAPSGIRWNGADGKTPWTHHGKALPYAQRSAGFGQKSGKAIAKVDMYNKVLDEPGSYKNAVIAVENAKCPILLISGKDDQLWPSERMANLIMERLKKHNFAYEYRHVSYPSAGHRIKAPGLDQSEYVPISEDTITHEILNLGGTTEGNRSASEQAWTEMIKTFRASLR